MTYHGTEKGEGGGGDAGGKKRGGGRGRQSQIRRQERLPLSPAMIPGLAPWRLIAKKRRNLSKKKEKERRKGER